MKKRIESLLGAALMLVSMISAFVPPTVAAENEPIELVPQRDSKLDLKDGNYIIKSGSYRVAKIFVDCTLTINKEAALMVNGDFKNGGTINILGSLYFLATDSILENFGTLRVAKCSGYLNNGESMEGVPIMYVPHIFENSVCMGCGYECPHKNGFTNGKCNDCGYECSHKNGFTNGKCNDCGTECPHTQTHTATVCDCCGKEMESTATGSILSQGYPEIVYAIASAVIFGFGGFLLGRKKKPVPSNGATADDEE